MSEASTFVFAGGGTGGHVYPALAVAEQLRRLRPDCQIHFLCSSRPIDAQILSSTGFSYTPLPATGWSWRPDRSLAFALRFIQSQRQAGTMMQAWEKPIVIGVGGFVAGPSCRAARRSRIPIALVNVDSVAGKANKLAGRWARDIFLQFDEARPAFNRCHATVHTVGCPLRMSFDAADGQRVRQDLELDPHKKTLLVTGASSGAQRINEAMMALLGKLDDFAGTWQVVHLTGRPHYQAVSEACTKANITYRVVAYYDNMADLQATADLIIGRSGAVSVAEFMAAGAPAICMPYPFHRDRHQYLNAGKLVEAGAAVIVDDVDNAEDRTAWLWQELSSLLSDEHRRRDMSEAAKRIAQPDAAQRIARHLLETPYYH